ncbi:MAG: Lanthionine-containing peptide SapB precursor RamS [Solirubrobacteraceae bacterium]|jgi:hypothetical protein|nr:Lanthionine-containing peptide SapB precursor RamS [Solirubrobacteraceae bacterium]
MAILDLQKMQGPSSDSTRAGRSGGSRHCGGHSSLSLALC